VSRFQARGGERLHWRVIVQSSAKLDPSRTSHRMAWHLVECADPTRAGSHCAHGQSLLASGGDPDGHCLVDDACPRCAIASVAQSSAGVGEPTTQH
jgi:hypothetical protein